MIKKDRYKGKEDDFQISIANYLDSLNLLWCHVTNESNVPVYYRAKLAKKGLKKGVPDILIFEPNKKFNGLAIELKANYNKPSEEQTQWLYNLKSKGWDSYWTNSIDECISIIQEYLKK